MPEQVAILGSGNVAYQLTRFLNKVGSPPKYIIPRSRKKGLSITDAVSPKTVVIEGLDLKYYDFSFLILCIPDNKIIEVLHEITLPDNCLIVHTSGSIPQDVFKAYFNSYFVMYPFQTFTKNRDIDLSNIPLFIEASDAQSYNRVENLGSIISQNIKSLDSKKRAELHLGGVITNNFTNHLIAEAFKYIQQAGLDRKDLMPLLQETLQKIESLGPEAAQTGPAIRGDDEVIAKHIQMLEKNQSLKKLYSLFSGIIKDTHS